MASLPKVSEKNGTNNKNEHDTQIGKSRTTVIKVKQRISSSNTVVPAAGPTASNLGAIGSNSQKAEQDCSIAPNGNGGSTCVKHDDLGFNVSDAGDLPSTTSTAEDFEKYIPLHSVRNSKTGITPLKKSELEAMNASENIYVSQSADIIITSDRNKSFVLKKTNANTIKEVGGKGEAQIRIISNVEPNMPITGILRAENENVTGNPMISPKTKLTTGRIQQQIHVGGRQTPAAQTVMDIIQQLQRRTSGPMIPSPGTHQSSIETMPLFTGGSATTSQTVSANLKTVAAEQKLIKFVESGQIKVVKTLMPREVATAPTAQINPRPDQKEVQVPTIKGTATKGRGSQVRRGGIRKKPGGTSSNKKKQIAKFRPITVGNGGVVNQQKLYEQLINTGMRPVSLQQYQEHKNDRNSSLVSANDQQVLTDGDGSPIYIIGEDDTVYQIAGQNAAGQIILVTQGSDGQKQYAYIAYAEGCENEEVSVNTATETVSELPEVQQGYSVQEAHDNVKTTNEDGTTPAETVADSELAPNQALVAQQQAVETTVGGTGHNRVEQVFIQISHESNGLRENIRVEEFHAGMPSPGGTRIVELRLQNGLSMTAEMSDDEFKALNTNT